MAEVQLHARVLGGAELTVGGRPLDLASAKAAALVIHLAVTGVPQSRTALAGLLWSDLPEAAARANLRLVLTKLRRAIPDHLVVTRQSVALTGPVTTDVHQLDSWQSCRGDLLEHFELPGAALFDDWVAGYRAAVHADMLALLDRAVRDAADRKDVDTGIEVARRTLALESCHEEAHRALMWFLALDGRRGAALAQYETCRRLLAEELGVEPAAATTALRDEIVAAGGFTGLPSPSPRPLTTLIGRAAELARADAMLADPACRLVTLLGPGGIGKTRLAREIAAARPGAVFVSLAGTGPAADLLVAHLARELGVPLAVPRDPLDLLADRLADRRLLLVLDNVEHLPDAAPVIAELLRRVPGLTVLATSRRRLGLGLEWLIDVPGLPVPQAVQLFEERARMLRPGCPLGPEGVERVCRLVGGVPLAIELAARWVRSAGPDAIADRLAGGLDLLATDAPDVEQRHRSVRAVIDWSCRLLTTEELGALGRLSVLHGSFDLPAAEAVAGADLRVLGSLVDQSLVAVGPDGRYRMHELLRQDAADRLAADPADLVRTRRRHAAHFAAAVPATSAADLPMDDLRAATEWLIQDADPDTLDAHLVRTWALHRDQGWSREAQAFLGAALDRDDATVVQQARWHRMLGEAYQEIGDAGPARQHLERTLSLLGARVPATTAGHLVTFGALVVRRSLRGLRPGGRVERGADRREVARERATAGFAIAEVYWVLGEWPSMVTAAIRSLDDAERAGDDELTARARAGQGMIVGTLGLRRLARRHLRVASVLAGRTMDPLTICWVANLSALHWLAVGDWAAVEGITARALGLRGTARTRRWTDETSLLVAAGRFLSGRYPEAAAAAREAYESGRERGDPVIEQWGALIMADTARATGSSPGVPSARLLRAAPPVDAARWHVLAARRHLGAGREADARDEVLAAHALLGPRPSIEPYGIEAHAGIVELCLALPGVDATTTASAVRRLRRFARRVPMARPRASHCAGLLAERAGRTRAARRAFARAGREAARLGMPYEREPAAARS